MYLKLCLRHSLKLLVAVPVTSVNEGERGGGGGGESGRFKIPTALSDLGKLYERSW